MNRTQVKGAAKQVAGKIQEQAGRLTGNKEQQAKGLVKQGAGKMQSAAGDVKESVKDASRDTNTRRDH